jgi:hypothetical protein
MLLALLIPAAGAVLIAQDAKSPPAPTTKSRDEARGPGTGGRLTPEELRRETESDREGEAERKAAAPKAKGTLVAEVGTRRLPRYSRPGFEAPAAEPVVPGTIPPRVVFPANPFALDPASRSRVRVTADALDGPVPAAFRAAAKSDATDFQITLKNSFIERFKNRVTIRTPFRVVETSRVHDPEDDAEIHIAGLADEVGLACVAEIMQAGDEAAATAAVRAARQSGDLVDVIGAWRLWCEHPGDRPQIQDDVIPEYRNSNPDHVFEIHPVSKFGPHDLRGTFRPIPGFEPKEARRAFRYYESIPCQIVPDPENQTTTLFTAKAKFNFVEFILRVDEDEQFITPDGRIVRCSALDLNRNVVARNRRMVFVRDTPPERAIRSLGTGSEVHVLGIPRIDLALVSWRARNAGTRPDALGWDLPYEIIVVGVYDD